MVAPSPAQSPVRALRPTFGIRDLRNESIVLGAVEGRRLFVKRWLAVAAVVVGALLIATVAAVFVLCLLKLDPTSRLPQTTASLSAIVYGGSLVAIGAALVASGTWALVVPQITLGSDALVARAVPFRPARTIDAADIPWHRGGRFVGPYLPTAHATVRRIGIAQLRRADRGALFAWLDAHAGEPARGT